MSHHGACLANNSRKLKYSLACKTWVQATGNFSVQKWEHEKGMTEVTELIFMKEAWCFLEKVLRTSNGDGSRAYESWQEQSM